MITAQDNLEPLCPNQVAKSYAKIKLQYNFGSVLNASEVVCDVVDGYEKKLDATKIGKSAENF